MKHGLLKRLLLLFVSTALAASMTACGNRSAQAGRNIRLTMAKMPTNVDPQLAESAEELAIVRNSFEGLMRVDGGKIVNAACEDCSISGDGLTYTFTLKKGLKWSDGSTLTADDFRFGLVRALRPETASPDAERLFNIKNAEAVHSGNADESTLGIESDGKRTLVITLSSPDSDLLETLTLALAMPCSEKTFERAKGRYAMKPSLMVSNGPFELSYWDSSSIRLTRSKEYVGDFAAVPAQVTLTFGGTDTERIENINSDFTDIALIDAQSASTAEDALLSVASVYDTSWALVINPKAAVVGDSAVSAALMKAVGANIYSDSLPSGFEPTSRLIADDVLTASGSFGEAVGAGELKSADPTGAKSDLIAALKSYKGKLPTVTIKYVDGVGLKQTVTRIAQNWQKELGAVVNIEQMSSADLEAAMQSGSYQVSLCPISPSDGKAGSIVSRFRSDSEQNVYGYADSKTDGLISSFDGSAEAALNIIQRVESDAHIEPVAQSGTCYAMNSAVTDVTVDIYQGHIVLYRAKK